MQMTKIILSVAIIHWLLIWGAVTQNHQAALAVQELRGPTSHHKLPAPQGSVTGPQGSASNPTTANAEYVEKLEGEIQALRSEREKLQSQGKDMEKKVHALNNRIYVRNCKIQAAKRGVPYATRLLDRKRLSTAKRSNHQSLGELQERVTRLKEHRDSVHGLARIRSNVKLSDARRKLRGELNIDAFMKKKEAGEQVESGKMEGTGDDDGDGHPKEFEEDPLAAQLKKSKSKTKLRKQKSQAKKAAQRTQQSHEPRNGHEKAGEVEAEAVGALTLEASHSHADENLDLCGDQLGDGSGEGEDSYDAGCFNEDFDLYVWGQECNT
ncbi:hypothetical protein H0H93_009586 [Arthromyces matolae]|nr:hypothetical protein H0H93_009586 [Arthromyces matolae]